MVDDLKKTGENTMDFQGIITLLSLLVAIVGVLIAYIQAKRYRGDKMGDYYVSGAVLRCYDDLRKNKNIYLGLPLTEEISAATQPHRTRGHVQRFEGDDSLRPYRFTHRGREFRAVSIYKSRHGAYVVFGSIGENYEREGGTNGDFGFPLSNEIKENGEVVQHFEGGRIYASGRIEKKRI